MGTLVIATFNRGKAMEFREMLSGTDISVSCMADYPGAFPPEENGKTLEENAMIKASYAAKFSGEWALGDDTGLEVKALGGAPGIYSARYAGLECDPENNRRLLLKKMSGIANRDARFVCSIALFSPEGERHSVSGIVNGRIAEFPRGSGGFGYDSIFVPENYQMTFAEMSRELKNSLSHRGKALKLIMSVLLCISGKNTA